MTIAQWSTTAANNASGVTGISWAEGQAPSTVNDSARETMAQIATWLGQASGAIPEYLTSVSGTNTVTATGPAQMASYVAGQRFVFLPANTNTGATTINITPSGASALGAKNIFLNGAALAGGEIKQNVMVMVVYDGTQFNLFTASPTASSGAGLTLIGAPLTASSSAQLDFTSSTHAAAFDGTYVEVVFDLVRIVPATDNVDLFVRFSQDGGSTFKAGASDYRTAIKSGSDATSVGDAALGAQTHIRLNSNGANFTLDNASADGWSGTMTLIDPNSTANHKHVYFSGSYLNNEPATTIVNGAGRYVTDTNAVNGVRFLMQSGNIASGTIYCRGKKKS